MKCDGEASLLHLWLLGGQPLTRNTLEPFGIAAVCLQRVFKFMINLLVLPVSRRQVLCYRGLREMRTGQQGWGAPWSHPTVHSHQGHPRGSVVLQVCVHLWGPSAVAGRGGSSPGMLGQWQCWSLTQGLALGTTCVTMQCPLTAHNRWGRLPGRVWTAMAFTGLSHVPETWSPGVLPAGEPWAHRPASLGSLSASLVWNAGARGAECPAECRS